MSSDWKPRKAGKLPPSSKYEVGYGKPPTETRFKPGESGNPRGRPKGSRNRSPYPRQDDLRSIFRQEANRLVPINEGGKTVTISMAQAIMRSLAVTAAKGNPRAQRTWTQLQSAVEREEWNERLAHFEAALDYKLGWERELERRKQLGLTGPEPLPHPDDVDIDYFKYTATLKGPASKKEKAIWTRWEGYRASLEEELTELKARLENPECRDREEVLAEIKQTEKVLKIIGEALEGSRAGTWNSSKRCRLLTRMRKPGLKTTDEFHLRPILPIASGSKIRFDVQDRSAAPSVRPRGG